MLSKMSAISSLTTKDKEERARASLCVCERERQREREGEKDRLDDRFYKLSILINCHIAENEPAWVGVVAEWSKAP